MKLLFGLLVIFLSINSFAQSGTEILGIAVNDGIVLAADSRTGFKMDTADEQPFAYYDESPKLFQLKQFIIGVSGAAGIGNTFYSKIIDDFNATSFQSGSLSKTLKAFSTYLDKQYPVTAFPIRNTTYFIAVGFEQGQPELIGFNSVRWDKRHDFTTNDTRVIKYLQQEQVKAESVPRKLENAIKIFARGEHLENTIGGPVSIVKVFENNHIEWVQNKFTKNDFKTDKDLIKQVKRGQLKMVYLNNNGKPALLQFLSGNKMPSKHFY